MSEKVIQRDGVRLKTEALGDPANPAVLLVMGVMASMLWWPQAFLDRLVETGHFVIRYDNRDTGLSTHYPPGKPGYSFDDMVDDAVAILDGYGIDSAHVVGLSMGGMIAQKMALRYPQRVLTLTLISTSPVGIGGLPPMTEAYAAHSQAGETVDWSDRSSVLNFVSRDVAMIASTKHPHDAEAAKRLILRDIERSGSLANATNHFILVSGEEGPEASAAEIAVPALAIHGTSDPLFPIKHGEALADNVPGARLLRVEGGGHEIHPLDINVIVDAIASHARGRGRA